VYERASFRWIARHRLGATLGATLISAACFGCKPTVTAESDAGDGGRELGSTNGFQPFVPKSATLPGDFSPPKDPVTHVPEPEAKPQWFGFDPFPGAELLCAEQVAAAKTGKLREIHWVTYGIAAPGSEIIAFYKRRDAGALELDRDETTFTLGKSHRLSVVRLPTTQPYPRCEHGPKPTHRAIVVVSQAEGK